METGGTCCFTGSRPGSLPWGMNEEHPDSIRLKELLRQEIEGMITKEGVRHFITGMALGTDLTATELVLERKERYPHITLESVIPYEEQAARWTVFQRERYYKIAGLCEESTMLQTVYSRDCMKKCSHYMVDHSEYVLAVWNGYVRSRAGETVRYARNKGRKIIIIHPETLEITRENQSTTAQE